VLQKIAEGMPASERALAGQSDANPQRLARMATRAEVRQPGAMERMFGQAGGVGLGGPVAGSLLGSIAGTVIGSMIGPQPEAGQHRQALEYFIHVAGDARLGVLATRLA
jgi:hypothetical protein